MENESSSSAFGRLIPHDAGRENSVHVPRYERSEESDPVTDADGVHSMNLRNAREDLAPPPSANRLRLHSPCLDLGKGEDGGGRARGLASSAPSGRDYGHVGVEASDIGGGEGSNERNECRVQFNACPRLGAENSVSDMGSGNRARVLPVAFGVRLGSGLDVDAGGHDESDDDQHHARKPEANPSARVAIPPNPVSSRRNASFLSFCYTSSYPGPLRRADCSHVGILSFISLLRLFRLFVLHGPCLISRTILRSRSGPRCLRAPHAFPPASVAIFNSIMWISNTPAV